MSAVMRVAAPAAALVLLARRTRSSSELPSTVSVLHVMACGRSATRSAVRMELLAL